MSRPSSSTRPETRPVGTVSCMRLRQRRNVDLPQPDGPMIATTLPSRTGSEMPCTAWIEPNHASSDSATRRVRSGVTAGASFAGRASVRPATWRFTSIATSRVEAGPGGDAGDDADDEDERDEDKGTRPREPVPVVVGTDCIVEDLKGQRGDRLRDRRGPELVAEGGEEERCGLAGDARERDEHARHDTGAGGAQHDREAGAPARIA